MSDRIKSLLLSEDNETPHQARCFLAHNLTLNQFTNLHALSLRHIGVNETMERMMNEIRQMISLVHLNIDKCCFQSTSLNIIWNLPRLTHCELNGLNEICWSNGSTVRSLSLRHFCVRGYSIHSFPLKPFFDHTPHLQSFAMCFDPYFHSYEKLSLDVSSIETLDLCLEYSHHVMQDLLKHVPNLSKLMVHMDGSYIGGHGWKNIITDYLPKLKVFRLWITFDYRSETDGEQLVDELLDTFRTDFWVKVHKWFFRCCWTSERQRNFVYFHTLSRTFSRRILDDKTKFKSTDPRDTTYDHPQSACVVPFRYSQTEYLSTDLLFEEKSWSAIHPQLVFHHSTML
ncbi:unnamed protein product [Adineta ricciae]|uniref:Uncharacterized protein n=1 Tax=Adineta ricciae TaxID=249248 RepID=A0A815FNY0_ADIRI|nr:unnamed protein product [Adineta ricciae]CAF1506619.1 unnamed protein product [Adineta ricciae]